MKLEEVPKKIKEIILKKDNMVILVLTGILLLVIAWPVSGLEKTGENENVSDLWDKNYDNIVNINN